MIIDAEKLESYREIVAFNKFKTQDVPFFSKVFPRADQSKYILHRAYIILYHRKPCFIINEYFPSDARHFDFQVAASDKKRILTYPRTAFDE
jgi:hypothetical protein